MPYVKPITFSTGSYLDANDYNSNVSAIASFYNEGIDYNDITDQSVSSQHIARPVVDIITQDAYRYFYQSGLVQINNLSRTCLQYERHKLIHKCWYISFFLWV
jgi:hypothetical protein